MIAFMKKTTAGGAPWIEFYLDSLEPTGLYKGMIINWDELPVSGRCKTVYIKSKCGGLEYINKMFNAKVDYNKNENAYVEVI